MATSAQAVSVDLSSWYVRGISSRILSRISGGRTSDAFDVDPKGKFLIRSTMKEERAGAYPSSLSRIVEGCAEATWDADHLDVDNYSSR